MKKDMTLAHVLRGIRAAQDVSQLALVLAMGATSTRYLSGLENGRFCNPTRAFLRRYVNAYQLLGKALTSSQIAQLTDAVVALPLAA